MLGFPDINYSLLYPFGLFLTYLVVIWLKFSGVIVGNFFDALIIGPLVFLFFILLVIKDTEGRFGIKIPLARTNKEALIRFWSGVGVGILFVISIGRIFGQGFNASSPLFLFESGGQSFATLQAASNPALSWVGLVLFPGFGETNTFNFILPILLVIGVGFFAGLYFSRATVKANKRAVISVAYFINLVLFAGLHTFNPVYDTTGEFITAALFILALTIATFHLPLGLEFSSGVHVGNNAAVLGLGAFFAFVFSPLGFVLALVFSLLFFALFVKPEETIQVFKKMVRQTLRR